MDQYFEMLSLFNKSWAEYPRDKVCHVTIDIRNGYVATFETGGLQILLGIARGPRGGITSLLIIVDPSQAVEVDKLVCCDCSISSGSWISSTTHIQIHFENKDFDDVAPSTILETMSAWKDNPELARVTSEIIGFGNTSVYTFSGGQVSPR